MFLRNAARNPAARRALSRRTCATTTPAPAEQSPWGMMGVIVAAGVGAYVAYEGQQQQSRFEALSKKVDFAEKCVVTGAKKKNAAFVFIKPHAVTPKVQALVTDVFQKAGIIITKEGDLDYKTIDEEMLIDTHYGAIANRAVKQDPKELVVPAKGQEGFEKMFGLSWAAALESGNVYNAKQACEKLGISSSELNTKWSDLSRGKDLIKFGGGFYCGKVDGLFIMNGFYMDMRAAYTTAPAAIHYYTVEWPAEKLSWDDFRGKVLGATDPATAEPGSARRMILDNYQSLGLKGKPDTGDNGVHASASPYEALAERMNWLKVDAEDDFYGQAMIMSGVSKDRLVEWSSDPVVEYDGTPGSLFDLLEDLGSKDCMEKAAKVAAQN